MGAYGLLELQVLQARDGGDLTFEGLGLWLAVFGVIACGAWLILDRKARTTPAWISLTASFWTLAVWILILMAV